MFVLSRLSSQTRSRIARRCNLCCCGIEKNKIPLIFLSFFIDVFPWTSATTRSATWIPVEWNAEFVCVAFKESITKMFDVGARTQTLNPKPYCYARNLNPLRSLTARERRQMFRSFAFIVINVMSIPRDFQKSTAGVSFVDFGLTLQFDARVCERWLRGARMTGNAYWSDGDGNDLWSHFISVGCVPTTWLKMHELR